MQPAPERAPAPVSGTGNTTARARATRSARGTGNTTGTGGGGARRSIPTVCTPGIPATSQLPRLTRAEYDKTTRDLLGLDVQPSSMLAPDTLGSVDQRAWDGFKAAADSLATQVLANATAKAKVLPCTTDNATCINQFMTTFGQKAFRRPLTTAEISKFTALYTNRATLTQSGTFNDAVTLIIKAFLHVAFIHHEGGDVDGGARAAANYALSSWEMASRLSYTLWGTMPDDTLFTAAQANKLHRRRRTSSRRRSAC